MLFNQPTSFKKQYIIFFLFATIIFSCLLNVQCSQKQKPVQDKNELGFVSSYAHVINKIQELPDYLAMVMLTRKDEKCTLCPKSIELYKNFTSHTKNLVYPFMVDCVEFWRQIYQREHLPACDPKDKDRLPVITFFVPPKDEFDPYKKQKLRPQDISYKDELTTESLVGYAHALMPNFREMIESEKDLNDFLMDNPDMLKVLLFNDLIETPPDYKGVTSLFRNRIEFGEISSNNTELCEKYNVTSFPRIILLKKPDKKINGSSSSQEQINQLDDSKFDIVEYYGGRRFDSLRAFLDRHALKHKKRKWKSEYEQTIDNKVKDSKITDLPEILSKNESWILIHFKTNVNASDHARLQHIQTSYNALFLYYQIIPENEEEKEQIEDLFGIRKWPDILIYPFGPKQEKHFIHVDQNEDLQQLAKDLMDYVDIRERLIDDVNIKFFYEDATLDNKYTVIWFYDTQMDLITQLVVHTMSSMTRFKKFLTFGRYPDPDQSSKKVWNFWKIPHVVTVVGDTDKSGQYKRAEYDQNTPFTYENLWTYLSQLSFNKEQEILAGKKVVESNHPEIFEEKCVKSGNPCMIAFLNTLSEEKFNLDLEHFDKLRENFSEQKLNWVWVDGLCHKEMIKKMHFTQEDLPFLVYYDHRKTKYKAMSDQSFTVRNMMIFIENLKRKKKGFNKLDEDLDMDERDCKLFIEKKHLEEQKANVGTKNKDIKRDDL